MGQLSIYLPPFAGAYTGVCSALFDFNCLLALEDAPLWDIGDMDYDEPRRGDQPSVSTQLRVVKSDGGDGSGLLERAETSARKLRPAFLALMGEGDHRGTARTLEERIGVPVLDLQIREGDHYESGVSAALEALTRRFVLPPEENKILRGVNLLGLTPLDFGHRDSEADITAALEARGFRVVSTLAMESSLGSVRRAARAQVDLVVSRSGLAAALELKRRFGIPYVAGVPLDADSADRLAVLLRATAQDGRDRILHSRTPARPGAARLLIVGDQIMGNSLRAALMLAGDYWDISVGSFFGLDPQCALAGDLALGSEGELIRLLRDGAYAGLIADPLITHLPPAHWRWWAPFPHPAVSSQLYQKETLGLMGPELGYAVQRWAVGRP